MLPISVVVPAYNAEQWLAPTLEGVRAQSEQPSEVIVVDDGSRDGTASLAASFGATVIRQLNAGVARARNNGIAAARFPWIALLDSDDVWRPDKLERQWKALNAAPQARWSITDYFAFENDGTVSCASVMHDIHGHSQIAERTALGDGAYLCDNVALARAQTASPFMLPSSTIAHKDLFEATGGFRDLRIDEDVDWFLRALTFSGVAYVDAPLVAYRRHAGSVTMVYRNIVDAYHFHLGLMLAQPDAYVPEALALARELYPRRLREQVRLYLRLGDMPATYRTLRLLQQARPGPTASAAVAAAAVLAMPPLRQSIEALHALALRAKAYAASSLKPSALRRAGNK
jgi:glycosyltransferase involved in cell wall biosynthesis